MTQDITIYFARKEQVIEPCLAVLAAVADYAREHRIVLPAETQLSKEPSGKPYLNTPEISLSISHSGDYWLTACSQARLGIDLQQQVDCRRQAVAKRFFHPDEYRWLESQHFRPFFSLWTAKESYAKYTGAGLVSFRHFSVVDEQGIVSRVGKTFLQFIPFADRYTLALCSEAAGEIILKTHF